MPASAMKLVQGLKEIVNRPDEEIYAGAAGVRHGP
jgi:hypothetical protein